MTTPGLELSLADHALLMIAISDNSASNVLIDAIGAEGILETQRSLALNGTNFGRRFLGRAPERGSPDNVTTAGDLVKLLSAIASGTATSTELCTWMLQMLAMQQFTDRLGRSLPATVTFAGKSGSLDGLSHDSGLLRSSKGTAAVAVLTHGIRDKHEAAMLIGRIGSSVVEDLGLA
jgi:beta-lactamase class A